jgi:large subunit ribosomal protein L2
MLTKKAKPFKKLLKRVPRRAGRNNQGRITTRHQGGGHKRLYRLVDFRQNDKTGIPARVETIEYDPYRTAFIALVLYRDGERRYVLAPQDLKEGDEIVASENAPLKPGNRTALKNLPIGTFIYNVELLAGQGGKLARSAGLSVQILANEDGFTHLKLPSKEIRRVSWDCWASIGQLSNQEYYLKNLKKAGRSRWLGIRPTVRGSAMNPRDHPYGGGEGRAPRGTKYPKTKWGKVTGGRKTRNRKKWSNKFVVKRRK